MNFWREREVLKVLIVDDEKYIRDELRYFLEKYDDIEICGESGEEQETLTLVETFKPDIVFLDIHLQDINGLLLARKIKENKTSPYIVFVTAYDKYAIEGFEINAADYILKPFSEERLKISIDRIKNWLNKKDGNKVSESDTNQEISLNKLCVEKNNRMKLIDIQEILFIEAQNNNIIVHARNETYACNSTLRELEEKFKKSNFVRTHKSFVVNINYINEIIPWFNYTYKIKLKGKDNLEIPVSRNYLKKFKMLLDI